MKKNDLKDKNRLYYDKHPTDNVKKKNKTSFFEIFIILYKCISQKCKLSKKVA